MIHFELRCREGGHAFDGWFRSGEEFDRQSERGLVSCPICGATAVEKALMRPALAQGKDARRAAPHASLEGEKAAALRERFAQIAREVRASSDYVGPGFAEEARRMHFGEAQSRPIWGEASREEVRALAEDGIPAFPLPPVPEDGH